MPTGSCCPTKIRSIACTKLLCNTSNSTDTGITKSPIAKPGRECAHNLRYWMCEEYLGLGASAHSYSGGRRFSFKRDIASYIDALENVGSETEIIDEDYDVLPSERLGEYVMLRLRLAEGIDTVEFERRFGIQFERLFGKYLDVYTENGFMQKRWQLVQPDAQGHVCQQLHPIHNA